MSIVGDCSCWCVRVVVCVLYLLHTVPQTVLCIYHCGGNGYAAFPSVC